MHSHRPVLTRFLFCVGVGGAVASAEPAANLSGASEERRVILNAATPSIVIDATATATADVPIIGGELGLTVTVDADASGSLLAGLSSATSGEQQETDVVDPQAQGFVRVGIAAFADCALDAPCPDELVVELARTDDALEGDLGLTFQLDGLADTEGTPTTGAVELIFE